MDGELVMIHGDTGQFFALKDVGLRIWNALDDEADLNAITAILQREYAVDPDTCHKSVEDFANQLVEVGFAEFY